MDKLHSASAALSAAVITLSLAPAGAAGASPEERLVGTWVADVTLLDCGTGLPIGATPFRALVVFHAGGTVTEAAGPSVQRTPSFGSWSFQERKAYVANSVFLTYDANGLRTGQQEIRRIIKLSPDGDSFVADTQTVGVNNSGNVLFRGCARGDARRFQ